MSANYRFFLFNSTSLPTIIIKATTEAQAERRYTQWFENPAKCALADRYELSPEDAGSLIVEGTHGNVMSSDIFYVEHTDHPRHMYWASKIFS